MAGQEKLTKKKVRAFPFPAALKAEGTGAASAGQVYRLAGNGFMVEMTSGPATIKVTDRFTFSFTLPVLRAEVAGVAVLVKLYHQLAAGRDQLAGGEAVAGGGPSAHQQPASSSHGSASPAGAGGGLPQKVAQIGEFHFVDLGDEGMRRVREFLSMASRRA
jgi:hypothetical protein